MKKAFFIFVFISSILCANGTNYTGYLKSDNSNFLINSFILNDDFSIDAKIIINSSEYSFRGIYKYNTDNAIIFSITNGENANNQIVINCNGSFYDTSKSGPFTLISTNNQIPSSFGNWTLIETPEPKLSQSVKNPSIETEKRDANTNTNIVNAFLPGISFSFLIPFSENSLYYGPNIHYAFIQGMKTHGDLNDFGGYYDWYMEIGYYKEHQSSLNDNIFFIYSTGINISFEKFMKSNRNYLIPYFGAKCGGVYFNHRRFKSEVRVNG